MRPRTDCKNRRTPALQIMGREVVAAITAGKLDLSVKRPRSTRSPTGAEIGAEGLGSPANAAQHKDRHRIAAFFGGTQWFP